MKSGWREWEQTQSGMRVRGQIGTGLGIIEVDGMYYISPIDDVFYSHTREAVELGQCIAYTNEIAAMTAAVLGCSGRKNDP